MNSFTISWNNLRAKPLATFLNLLLLTLGVSIISLLLMLNEQLSDNFNKNIRGIDMVVGAKGSPLQLILASVYHIDNPTGNISMAETESLLKNPLVEKGIPLAYGDNYQGYRILGTNHDYTDHYKAVIKEGALWEKDFEVTLGSTVAQRMNLKIGDTFQGAHGLVGDLNVHDEADYRVVGILTPSKSVVDQLILTNIGSIWGIHAEHEEEAHDHDGEEHEEHHEEEDREITALLIKFRSPMGTMMLPRMINEQTSMQAALPAIEINRLFSLFAVGIDTLRAIALAIIVISGISVFISLYSSLRERKYELALMRTLGASRLQLFVIIILEGLILAFVGYILGILLSRMGMWFLSKAVISDYHYDFDVAFFLQEEGYLLGITLFVGFLAALLPAIQAFRTDISETLSDE